MKYFFSIFITLQASLFAFADEVTEVPVVFEHGNKNLQTTFSSSSHSFRKTNNFNIFDITNDDNMGTFLFDINGDGKKELFVYIDDHIFCGTRGCSTKIVDFSGSHPTEILDTHTYKGISILDKKTNGYNNIGILGDKEAHIKPSFVVLHWDGVQYRHIPDAKSKQRN